MTCQECRDRKAKCNKNSPCERCNRLGKECVPYISKQGQRPKKRQKQESNSSGSNDGDDHDNDDNGTTELSKAESEVAGENVVKNTLETSDSQHYGLNHVIRHWVAIAFRRRSFNLLYRAASLAITKDISFDQILCGRAFPGVKPTIKGAEPETYDMSYIVNQLSQPKESMPMPRLMSLDEVPTRLVEEFNLKEMNDRWIVYRKIQKGDQSFFASPAFERDIVSCDNIRNAYWENEVEWSSLFLTPEERGGFHKVTGHLFSHYTTAESIPPTVTISLHLDIKELQRYSILLSDTENQHSVVEVNMTTGMDIINRDTVIICHEFVRLREGTTMVQNDEAFEFDFDFDFKF